MRKTLRASLLLLALCCPGFAGDIPNPPIAPPSEPPGVMQIPTPDIEAGATTTTADDYIQNGAAVTFVEVLLTLLALS